MEKNENQRDPGETLTHSYAGPQRRAMKTPLEDGPRSKKTQDYKAVPHPESSQPMARAREQHFLSPCAMEVVSPPGLCAAHEESAAQGHQHHHRGPLRNEREKMRRPMAVFFLPSTHRSPYIAPIWLLKTLFISFYIIYCTVYIV